MPLKTFVINLKKNVDRMESIDRQLVRHGMSYERFEATYGKTLAREDRGRKFHRIHSLLAMGRKLTDGEIGCALSHVGVYERMISDDLPVALVLEDDIFCEDIFPSALDRALKAIDVKKPQVVLFSGHGATNAAEINLEDRRIERVDGGMCTDAYLITLPAARIVHRANFPVVTVADSWRRWCRRYGLEVYRVCPPAVRQMNDRFGTDVSQELKASNPCVRFARKMLRIPEHACDAIWFGLRGR